MDRLRFTEAEAQAKVGKVVHSLVEFSGVPKGSTGRVIKIDDLGDGWDVVIQWDLLQPPPSVLQGKIAGAPVVIVDAGNPLQDWFTRDEYEKYLEEL
jgi:hypothetical protein